jgi:hypothetical protein
MRAARFHAKRLRVAIWFVGRHSYDWGATWMMLAPPPAHPDGLAESRHRSPCMRRSRGLSQLGLPEPRCGRRAHHVQRRWHPPAEYAADGRAFGWPSTQSRTYPTCQRGENVRRTETRIACSERCAEYWHPTSSTGATSPRSPTSRSWSCSAEGSVRTEYEFAQFIDDLQVV